jgi:hypothetical protein
MNFHNAKQHRVWRPRMDSGNVFNPFTRSTESERTLDSRTLGDIEEVPHEAEAERLKSNPS